MYEYFTNKSISLIMTRWVGDRFCYIYTVDACPAEIREWASLRESARRRVETERLAEEERHRALDAAQLAEAEARRIVEEIEQKEEPDTLKTLRALTGHDDRVKYAEFSPDGRSIVTGAWDGTARLWEVETGTQLKLLMKGAARAPKVFFLPNGNPVIAIENLNSLTFEDTSKGNEIFRLDGFTKELAKIETSLDAKQIITIQSGVTVAALWNTSGHRIALLRDHLAPVLCAAFSPDGLRVATGSLDKTVLLWNTDTGDLFGSLRGHDSGIRSIAFSPDGRRIVTGSDDMTARVWNAESGIEIAVLNGHKDTISSASFSPNGLRILTASHDGTVRIW